MLKKIRATAKYTLVEAIRELPLQIIPIIFLLTCSTPDEKDTKPSVEPVKIKGRIQIDEIKYSGPPTQSWIVAGIRDTVTNDLAKVKEVEAISIDDQNKALKMITERRKAGEKNLDPSKESAKILAADYLCVGNLQNTGKVLRLNIRLLKAPDFIAEQTATIDGTLDEIFTLQDKVVESLLANVDAKMTPEERLVIEVFTPKNKKAYELYEQGLEIKDTNPKKALDLVKQALQLEPDYLDALSLIGSLYLNFEQKKEAMLVFSKLVSILENKKLENHILYFQALREISYIENPQNYDAQLKLILREKKILEKSGLTHSEKYAKFLNSLAGIYMNKRENANSLNYFLEAKELLEKLNMRKSLPYLTVMNNAGLFYKSEYAINEYLKIQILYKEMNLINTSSYSMVMRNIGFLYYAEEKFDESIKFFLEGKKIYENLGMAKTTEYAALLSMLGNALNKQEKYSEALNYYSQIQKIYESQGMIKSSEYSENLLSISVLYFKKEEYCKSVELLKKAVEIQESIGVQSSRKDIETVQSKCDFSKPVNVEQEKKKVLDWIKRNTHGGWDENHLIVKEIIEEISNAIRLKKRIWIAIGHRLLISNKNIAILWKNNRFSVHDLSDEEVRKMELQEMGIKYGEFDE